MRSYPFPELLRALKRGLVYDNIFPKNYLSPSSSPKWRQYYCSQVLLQ
jgi:hypothetical protein